MRTFEIGRYDLKRVGQRAPIDGDEVRVTATVYLPDNEGCLSDDIVFGSRCRLCGEELYSNWGRRLSDGSRYRDKTFYAPTWDEASGKASEWAEGELDCLAKMVAARRKVLADADATVGFRRVPEKLP